MKVGVVGAGAVGSACFLSLVMRGSAREVVLVNRDRKRARGVVTDIQYGAVLSPPISVRDGDYSDLAGSSVVMITAGVNEKGGGATDRNDPVGRLRLLDANAAIFQDIVPRIHYSPPEALILVVTDPPDALADVVRIGMVSARLTEMILGDERAVIPVGYYNPTFGVALSLSSVIWPGRRSSRGRTRDVRRGTERFSGQCRGNQGGAISPQPQGIPAKNSLNLFPEANGGNACGLVLQWQHDRGNKTRAHPSSPGDNPSNGFPAVNRGRRIESS